MHGANIIGKKSLKMYNTCQKNDFRVANNFFPYMCTELLSFGLFDVLLTFLSLKLLKNQGQNVTKVYQKGQKIKVRYIKKDKIVEFKGEKKIFFYGTQKSFFGSTLLKIFPNIIHSYLFMIFF